MAVNEIVTCVNIALGSYPADVCPPCDANSSGSVTVTELVRAVSSTLEGCTPVGSPTATPTEATPTFTVSSPTSTRTSTPTATRTQTETASPTPTATRLLLTRLASTSPGNGESGVAVTRETILRFSAPLDSASVDSAAIFAEFGGEVLGTQLHVSADGRTVTLFYAPILPGSARIRVTVDGDVLRDTTGSAVDGDGDGEPGGRRTIDFETLSLTAVEGTAAVGRVFASELVRAAEGLETVTEPLAGVTITVDGKESELFTTTDEFGNFRLEPAPAGRFFVHIDGRTATNPIPEGAYYPFVGKAWEASARQETVVGDVFLPLVQAGTLRPVSDTEDTEIPFSDAVLDEFPELAGVKIIVPAGSLYADDGTSGGMVGIAPVPPDRLPGRLPPGLDFPIVITVQTDGPTNFDVPVAACFPNLAGRAPGEKSALWSFNHDTGRFEVVGSMTVTEDGTLVCTDEGVGILAPGWHGENPGTSGSGGDTEDPGDPDDPSEPEPQCFEEEKIPDHTGKLRCRQECRKFDEAGKCVCWIGEKVLLDRGEELFERTDLVIPGRGDIHFVMQRWYRSRLDHDGPLGHGWDYSYSETLFPDPDGTVDRSDGSGHIDGWGDNGNGTFSSPPGHFRDLIRREDGTYVLRDPNGFKRYYRTDGRLYAYQDRNGNRMLFDYDARGNLDRVIDAYSREIDFVFESFPDGTDRLVRIVDFIGRVVVYTYDENGDLVEVRTPLVTGTSTGNDFPNGRAERYTYSSGFAEPDLNQNLLTVTYPEEVANDGPPALEWTYGTDLDDPLTFDRVLSETEGGTNASGVPAGGTMTFVYEKLNENEPLGQPDLPRGKATITERNGKVMEYFVNERGHHIITRRLTQGLRPDEPAFYETRTFYDEDGLPLRRVLPEGNEILYAYDSGGPRNQQQNLLERRRVAGPRGGGEDLITTFTYEPLYNQLASVTGPRGNSTGFTPPIGTASAERYTANLFFDYQEDSAPIPDVVDFEIDISGVARGLGDLNGDGRTDQVAGNVVRTEGPAVELLPASNEAKRLDSTQQAIITETQWNDRGQLVASIDPEGNVDDYNYYPENDPDGDGVLTFSAFGPLSAAPNGYRQARIVDSRISGRRSTSALPTALETVTRYDPVGNVVAVRNPRGIETHLEVNQLNEPVVVTRGADVSNAPSDQLLTGEGAFGYLVRSFYDHNGRVTRTETENRDSTTTGVGDFVDRTFTYDILNNLVEQTVEVDAKTTLRWTFGYDPNELAELVTQPEGNRTRTTYDERNLPFTITRGDGSPDASTMRIDYDLNANLQHVVDAEDNDGDDQPEVTTYVYDGFDRLVTTIDRLGNESSIEYDVGSNIVATSVRGHPAGAPTASNVLLSRKALSHDELDRVFQVDEELFLSAGFAPGRPVSLQDGNSDGLVTTLVEYDALSRRTFVIEDDLQVTQTIHDGADRPIEVVDAIGNMVLTSYDRNSNPIEVRSVEVSPEGLVAEEIFSTLSVYDQLDRLVRFTDNAGQTARFDYDSRDNLVASSDAEGPLITDPLRLFSGNINEDGNTTTFTYDGFDRRLGEVYDLRQGGVGGNPLDTGNPTNTDGQVAVSYEWDGNSRQAAMIDDNGNRTEFGYDALDRKTLHRNADLTTYVYDYDRDDNITRVIDANGSIIERTYDALDRLVRVDVSRAAGVGGTVVETYEYDGLSRRTASTDDNGSVGTVQGCEYVYDSLSRILEDRQNGQVASSVWSGDGKRLSCTYPGGREISNTFDAIDRVKTISDGNGVIAEWFWVGPGYRELKHELGNGTTFTLLNDSDSQGIGYDEVKRVIGLRAILPDNVVAFVDREYGYNRADQRTFERRHDDFGLTDSYSYDSLYRLVASEFDLDGTVAATPRDFESLDYVLDGVGNRRQVDRMTTSGGLVSEPYVVNEMNEYPLVAGVARVSDANGNLVDDGSRIFTYDYKNRLIAVRDKSSGTPIAEYFYYTDNRRSRKNVFMPAAKDTTFFYDGWQVCEERDGASNTPEVTHVWSPVFIDALVQSERTALHPLGAAALYAHQDVRNSIVSLTDGNGNLVESLRYDDYGNPEQISLVANPYLFQGRRFDDETGIYYYRNRYYSPISGRFLQRDSVSDPLNLGNRYSLTGNRPITLVDPYGLRSDWSWWEVAQGGVDFLRGMGDTITFGGTKWIREQIHGEAGDVINEGGYFAGEVGGTIISTAVGGAAQGGSLVGAAQKALRYGEKIEETIAIASGDPRAIGQKLLGQAAKRARGAQHNVVAPGGDMLSPSGGPIPAANLADGSVQFRRWKRGEPIDKPMRDGSAPSWDTVRSRYWKNRYHEGKSTGDFTKQQLKDMRKGNAPKDFNPRTERWESRELHHVDPQRHTVDNSPLNLRELTPDWHAEVDPFRRVDGIEPIRGMIALLQRR